MNKQLDTVKKLERLKFKIDNVHSDAGNPEDDVYQMSRKTKSGAELATVEANGSVNGQSLKKYLDSLIENFLEKRMNKKLYEQLKRAVKPIVLEILNEKNKKQQSWVVKWKSDDMESKGDDVYDAIYNYFDRSLRNKFGYNIHKSGTWTDTEFTFNPIIWDADPKIVSKILTSLAKRIATKFKIKTLKIGME